MMFTDSSRGRDMAKDPAVVKFKGKYYLYYSIAPNASMNYSTWDIGIAVSGDMESWEKIGELDRVGDAEKPGICAPAALLYEGKIHLFYQTYGRFVGDSICHAYSEDGIHFTRNETNPIIRAEGSWNCGRAIDADVVIMGDELYMYFATRDPELKTQMLAAAKCPLDGKFDRLSWQIYSDKSILRPELPWEQECIEAAAAMTRFGKVYLFYAGAYNNCPQQIGVAVSRDGISFERIFNEPFLKNGEPGSWNESESGHPYVFEDDDGRVYLFYQGNNTKGSTWYLSKKEVAFRNEIPYIIEQAGDLK